MTEFKDQDSPSDQAAKRQGVSLAELVRRATEDHLEKQYAPR